MAQGGNLLVRIGCTIVGGLWLGVWAYLRLRNRPA